MGCRTTPHQPEARSRRPDEVKMVSASVGKYQTYQVIENHIYMFFLQNKEKGGDYSRREGGGGEMIFNSALGELWPHYALEVQKV